MVLRRIVVLSGICVLAACGGQSSDPLTAVPSQPIFQSETFHLSNNDFVVKFGADQFDLSPPDFVDGAARYQAADQSYVAFNGGDILVVAGEKNGQHFSAIAGEMAPLFSYDRVVFDAKVNIVQGAYASQFPIALTINFGWGVPRLLGGGCTIWN